ncbi:HAMP domain-containing sensor histidine kinase [Anaerosacchariphilus polymeriproducens]|uniref:histidine kinase n=1 Tax=Anaerosacchariphilus polymeriproducens TaxID=1812858 RepID=A0A371AZ96_9FIRM|nr:HAMP domain-containing sensor histidine kinase [Anaerosacchariphilus polymeriproducens]RDU24873.1 sensor histidine kinase [Anaerosacchariphilus polymeriproducens]
MGIIHIIRKKIKYKAENLGIRKSLFLYIFVGILTGMIVWGFVVCFVENWKTIIVSSNDIALIDRHYILENYNLKIKNQILLLEKIEIIALLFILLITIFLISHFYYKRRLKEPFEILKKEMQYICRDDLSFDCSYITDDEMGMICVGFNKMRLQLIKNRKNLWDLMENQRQLNAAFAHDIRTPLTIMKSYTQLLLKYYQTGKISEARLFEIMKIIDNQVDRLETFSSTMKEIHSFEVFKPGKKRVNLKDLVKIVRNNVKGMDRDIQVSMRNRGSNDNPKEIYCDCNLIQEVLDNLIVNAIRFAKNIICVELVLENENLFIFVKDDGKGFDPEALEKATHPYFSTDRNHFGLGLTISKILTKKHGGDLELMNSIHGGAIVCAYFYIE